jgi:hypothetical protein
MMTTEPIIESELTFGPFPEGHCFRIEKSQTYKLIEDGVKTVEFLLLRPNSKAHKTAIWMIEAKKSSPDPKSHGNLDKRIEKMCEKLTDNMYLAKQIEEICIKLTPSPFDTYIEDICNKFISALALFIAIRLERHSEGDSELSDDLKQIDLANVRFVFVLVINNCEEEWLPPIQEALNKALRPTIKTWNLLNVLVLNKDMARRKQLIDLASIQI